MALFFTLLFAPLFALAEVEFPEEVLKSVVFLRGNGICASGVVLDSGLILTNAHVTEDICPKGDCGHATISHASSLGGEPVELPAKVKLVNELHSVDLAILEWSEFGGLTYGISLSEFEPRVGDQVHQLSFPRCQGLELSSGVIEEIDAVEVKTTTKSAKGSSGGPMLDANFRLIALDKASDLDFLPTLLFNYRSRTDRSLRSEGKAVRTRYIQELSGLFPVRAMSTEVKWINQYAEENLDKLTRSERMRKTFRFRHLYEKVFKKISDQGFCEQISDDLRLTNSELVFEKKGLKTLTIISGECRELAVEGFRLKIHQWVEEGPFGLMWLSSYSDDKFDQASLLSYVRSLDTDRSFSLEKSLLRLERESYYGQIGWVFKFLRDLAILAIILLFAFLLLRSARGVEWYWILPLWLVSVGVGSVFLAFRLMAQIF